MRAVNAPASARGLVKGESPTLGFVENLSVPTITVPISAYGVLVNIVIRPAPSQLALFQTAGLPAPSEHPCRGFVDPGANITVIDWNVIAQMGMKPFNGANATTLGGQTQFHKGYEVEIALVAPGVPLVWFPVKAIVGSTAANQCEVALGRDSLANLLMIYDGPKGQAQITW